MTSRPRELEILDVIAQVLGDADLGDDAFFDPATRRIDTSDLLIEGRHFSRAYCSAFDVGWKAAAVNISDIAAMGGQLRHLLVSLGVPGDTDLGEIRALYQGLDAITRQHGGRIVGGDTVSAPQWVINVSAVGELPAGHVLGQRNAARPGDFIVSSGQHGLSAVGLQVLRQSIEGYDGCQLAHRRPVPRVEAGLQLSQAYARYALMDTSDGLADAALKIAMASNVRIVLDQSRVPLHPEVAAYAHACGLDPWPLVLYGGEDFELLATVPDTTHCEGFQVIGKVAEGQSGAFWQDASGALLPLTLAGTYDHFANEAGAP